MRHKLFLTSALTGLVALGAGATIAWAATGRSAPATTPAKASWTMHNPAQMREHMQAVHPSLSKAEIDRLVAECQQYAGSMMDGSGMTGGQNMMGGSGHAGHHRSGTPGSGTRPGGMMSGGMMG